MTKAHLALAAISATTALGLTIPTTSYASPTPEPTEMTESPGESPESTESPTGEETDGEESPEATDTEGSPEASPSDESGLPAAFKEAVTKSTSTSSSGTIDFNVTKEGEKSGSVKAKVTYAYQPKPKPMGTFKIMDLSVNGESKNAQPQVLLDGETVYVNPGGLLPSNQGKQWLKVSLSKIPGGSDFSKMLSDPNLSQKVLAAYENVHVVGQETVDGVPLTRYAGTIDVAALNQAMGMSDKNVKGWPEDLDFDAWVDAQSYVRKSEVKGSGDKGSIKWTTLVREYGRPVTIPTPPAGQVAELNLDQYMHKSPSPMESPMESPTESSTESPMESPMETPMESPPPS